MKIFEVMDFSAVTDPIKTEESIYEQLLFYAPEIQTDYVYAALPIADLLNKIGIANTQKVIDSVCENEHYKKLFFVCQHIRVKNLDFHGHIVFTTHATVLDSYLPLPHYSCNYDEDYALPWKDRKYTFSFMGSFFTHPVRKEIYKQLNEREDCLIVDTGDWHYNASRTRQAVNSAEYIKLLGNTKYSLCPRGTGPSSIRIWEAMAMGSAPIIVSDFLKMPLERDVPRDAWFKVPEEFDVRILERLIAAYPTYDNSIYFDKFSNDNLYKSVAEVIQRW